MPSANPWVNFLPAPGGSSAICKAGRAFRLGLNGAEDPRSSFSGIRRPCPRSDLLNWLAAAAAGEFDDDLAAVLRRIRGRCTLRPDLAGSWLANNDLPRLCGGGTMQTCRNTVAGSFDCAASCFASTSASSILACSGIRLVPGGLIRRDREIGEMTMNAPILPVAATASGRSSARNSPASSLSSNSMSRSIRSAMASRNAWSSRRYGVSARSLAARPSRGQPAEGISGNCSAWYFDCRPWLPSLNFHRGPRGADRRFLGRLIFHLAISGGRIGGAIRLEIGRAARPLCRRSIPAASQRRRVREEADLRSTSDWNSDSRELISSVLQCSDQR